MNVRNVDDEKSFYWLILLEEMLYYEHLKFFTVILLASCVLTLFDCVYAYICCCIF